MLSCEVGYSELLKVLMTARMASRVQSGGENAFMENQYTGVFEHVGDWWPAYVEELPGCNVQERTLEEARESLKEAIQAIVQANRELARRESEGHDVVWEPLAVAVE
jgi:predicted RNase H-like HicB family nuclease